MYQKHIDKNEFIAAHASGLKDHELATMFNVGIETVKRRRKAFALRSNCQNNNRGKLAEAVVAAHVREQGLNVMPAGTHKAPYDLCVNGWRVEVRLGSARANDGVQFRLQARRGSNGNRYRYNKDFQRDTDFFALAVIPGSHLEAVYVLPVALWQDTITVHPTSRFCNYRGFLDDWSPLRTAARTAA